MSGPAISNICDCHFHVMGPPDRYEFLRNHVYSFEPAPLSDYLKTAASVGIERYVLVQPSIYQLDNRCLLDSLDQLPVGSARGIVAIGDDTSLPDLKAMHERGVRGVRFNMVQGPERDLDFIMRLACRISKLGWHLEIYVTGDRLSALQSILGRLPVPVVLDHMGQIALGSADEHEQISCLRRLLDSGNVWVKLIGYRLSVTGFPYDDADRLASLLVSQYLSRCLWGSDWPNTNFKGRAPTPHQLLAALARWTSSESERSAILAHNPAEIYDLAT